MVGGSTNHHQQAPHLDPPSSSTAPTTTPEEEEFLKRNTDCVYFLASPLTCKKGSECEYRHSDVARVNPRDCWYWLNGNCLNPKCGFRHPPLDGLLGAEVPAPNGSSVPQLQTPVTPKQGVACIFFQKGFCLKGHLCPFLHGPPNSVHYKAQQSGPAPNPATEPPKTSFSGPEKSIQDQKFTQQANVQKPVEFLPPQGKQPPRMQAPPLARNGGGGGGAIEKNIPPPSSSSVEEPPRYRSANVVAPPVLNDISSSRSNRGVYQAHHVSDNDCILNGKDSDGYSRDPSPGFDVLVDNELGDSEFYHNEEQFGRSRGHSYDVDQDMYREQRDYDHYNERDEPRGGRYAWDDHRVSSERMLAQLERNRNPRNGSPDQFDESDLRHRISKQRRGNNNGLRSVVGREHDRDSHTDRMHRRESHHPHRDQGSLGSRLRGRIKIPGRSTSPHNEEDLRAPGRPPHASSSQSRLRDRIKGRLSDDYNNDGRDYRASRGRQDTGYDNGFDFTGPKRLSELKSGRSGEGFEQSLGKRKYPRVESQQSEDDLSFEGPKPLSEILKRKRGAETTAVVDSRISSSNNKVNNLKEFKNNEENSRQERKEEPNTVSAEFGGAEKQTGSVNADKDNTTDGQPSLNHDANEEVNGEEVNEEGLMDEDAMLDQELEAYDHRDGDYDYEQIDGEDYNLDEGENPDEEYLDEEDGDEYAKKESVVYS